VRQSERLHREGHAVSARPVKTIRAVGDITNDTADLWTKGNLRVKRRDPWHQANAQPKVVADLELSGEDADKIVADVSLPGSRAGGCNHQPKRAEKPHSIIQPLQGAERPCYEAGDSVCRGE
jgi:hypothetical protein